MIADDDDNQDTADLQAIRDRKAAVWEPIPLNEALKRLETSAGDEYRAEALELAEVDVEVKDD